MVVLSQSTKSVSEKKITREWYCIDVGGKVLGRIAAEIVKLLQGKHKTNYVSYLDMGDNVIVINAQKVKLTGNKSSSKIYRYYSGYPGGLRSTTAHELLDKKPEEVIRHAVSGMLPKNKLRDRRLARLFVFSGKEHPYEEKLKRRS